MRSLSNIISIFTIHNRTIFSDEPHYMEITPERCMKTHLGGTPKGGVSGYIRAQPKGLRPYRLHPPPSGYPEMGFHASLWGDLQVVLTVLTVLSNRLCVMRCCQIYQF